MLDSVRLLQIASNHLETVFLVLDWLKEGLDLIHFVIEARALVLGVLIQTLLKVVFVL